MLALRFYPVRKGTPPIFFSIICTIFQGKLSFAQGTPHLFLKKYIFYLLNINRLALFTKVFFKYHLHNPNTAPIFAPQLRNDGNKPNILDCGVEQLVARWAHNPKATGSSPVPATTKPWIFQGFFILYHFEVK